MKPLSPRKRRAYVSLMVLLFFLAVPLAILYANGYRYREGFGFVRTGGMYLSVPYAEATIFLDDKEIEHTSFLNKNFYINDLAPSSYEVRVVRVGSHAWKRVLRVEGEVVTKADVVLPPLAPRFVRITRGGITSSTTRGVSADLYDTYTLAFKASATSTRDKDVVALVENGNVRVRWSGSKQPPDNFCFVPASCTREIAVEEGNESALSVAFFSGGVIFSTRESGVHFAEIDVRPVPTSVTMYPKAGADARVVGDSLIVKDGTTFYLLEEF